MFTTKQESESEALQLLGPAPEAKIAQEMPGKIFQVLIAEDHPINRKVFEKQFAFYPQYRVTMVSNGLAAVKAMEVNNYDIILMDEQMPVLNGTEAIARIRAMTDPKKKNVPIIMVSASPIDPETCVKLNFTSLMKPYDMKTFFHKIKNTIEQPASHGQVLSVIPESGFFPSFLQAQQVASHPVHMTGRQAQAGAILPEALQKKKKCCCTRLFGKK